MVTYLNQADRSKVLKLVAIIGAINEVEEESPKLKELFGKSFADLKRARTYVLKALESLADTLGEEQSRKVFNMAKWHDVVLIGRAAPRGKSEAIVEMDKLFDLAELAIANHCHGCERQDHKSCRVYHVLSAADIPPADTVTTAGCPYRQ